MPGGLETVEVAPLFRERFLVRIGREPTEKELQSLLCVSRFDGGYGSWPADSDMIGSRNMGAIKGKPEGGIIGGPSGHRYRGVPHKTFEIIHGARVDIVDTFRAYDSWEDAADDYLNQMCAPRRPETFAALSLGDLTAVAEAMHHEGYFTADPHEYAAALWAQAQPIANLRGVPCEVALGPLAASPSSALPVLVGLGCLIAYLLHLD